MTFKDSSWLLSIVVPHPPHFASQPDGVFTLWGYGLFVDNPGDYVKKPMAEASGQEILTEVMHHLGFEDILDEVRRTTTVIPVMMPYITSEFQRRDLDDRPLVIPPGAKNFALLGQYVEIPDDVVFTVEYSVRGAMHGVYGLLGLKNEILPIYHGIADPKGGAGQPEDPDVLVCAPHGTALRRPRVGDHQRRNLLHEGTKNGSDRQGIREGHHSRHGLERPDRRRRDAALRRTRRRRGRLRPQGPRAAAAGVHVRAGRRHLR